MMINRTSGRAFFPSSIRANPDMSGIRRSVMTRSKSEPGSFASPSAPFRASSTPYPSSRRTEERKERISSSSSTTRIFFGISPFPRDRKMDGEDGPTLFPVGKLDPALHPIDHFLRVCQSQTGAVRLRGMERGEQPGQFRGGNAGTGILDPDDQPMPLRPRGNLQDSGPPHRLDGIPHAVDQYAAQFIGIRERAHAGNRLHFDFPRPAGSLRGNGFLEEGDRIDGLGGVAFLPGEKEEVVHQGLDPFRAPENDPKGLLAGVFLLDLLVHPLRVSLDAPQRIPDLVGERGGHLPDERQAFPPLHFGMKPEVA